MIIGLSFSAAQRFVQGKGLPEKIASALEVPLLKDRHSQIAVSVITPSIGGRSCRSIRASLSDFCEAGAPPQIKKRAICASLRCRRRRSMLGRYFDDKTGHRRLLTRRTCKSKSKFAANQSNYGESANGKTSDEWQAAIDRRDGNSRRNRPPSRELRLVAAKLRKKT